MGHLKIAKETLLLRTSAESSDLDASDVADIVLRPVDTDGDIPDERPNASSPDSGPFHAREASVLVRTDRKSPQSIMGRLIGNDRIIELCSVDFEHQKYASKRRSESHLTSISNHHEQQLTYPRKIRIFYPYRIVPHCITLTEHEDHVVLDVICGTRYLYTVQLPMSAFFASTLNLTDANAKSWRVVHSPYAFDLRQPLMMHAVSSSVLVVSLKDGGLLRLTRHAPLESIDTAEFSDERNLLSKFLPWGGDKVPGKPGYSSRAIISMDHHSGLWGARSKGLLAAITVNKKLRLWSIDGLDLVHEDDIVGDEQTEIGFFDPTPQKLISFARDTDANSKSKFVLILLPSGNPRFKLWEFVDLLEPRGSFTANMPDDGAVWFIADFLAGVNTKRNLDMLISWKCGNNSCLMEMRCPADKTDDTKWFLVEDSETQRKARRSYEDESLPDYWLARLFGPTGYSRGSIFAALSIYVKKMSIGQSIIDPKLHLSLEEQVTRTVGAPVSAPSLAEGSVSWDASKDFLSEIQKQWVKFENLCAEIDSDGKELLALSWTAANEKLVIRSQFMSVVRELQPAESLMLNGNSYGLYDTRGKVCHEPLYIVKLARDFRESFDSSIQKKLFLTLKNDSERAKMYLTLDRMSQMYHDLMAPHETVASVAELCTGLRQISGANEAVSTVLALIDSNIVNTKFFVDLFGTAGQDRSTQWQTLSIIGSHALNTIIYELVGATTDVVVDMLFLLVFVSGYAPELVSEHGAYFASYVRLLRSLTSYTELQRFGRPTQQIIHRSSRNMDLIEDMTRLSMGSNKGSVVCGQSFMEWFISQHELCSITSVWHAISIHHTHSPSQMDVAKAAILALDLYAYCRELGEPVGCVTKYMRLAFDHDYESAFIQGCLLAACGEGQNAVPLLKRASIKLAQRSGHTHSKLDAAIRRLDPVLVEAIGHGYVKYFDATSQYVYGKCQDVGANSALELALCGIQFLGQEPANGTNLASLLKSIGEFGLVSQDNARGFTESYNALTEMTLHKDCCSKQDIELATINFVERSVECGYGLELCKLPFIGLTDLVTHILENKVKDVQCQTEYYRVLYAWKLARGDYAGAAAAVYEESAKLRNHDDKLETLMKRSGLLITAMNALSCVTNANEQYIVVNEPIDESDGDLMKRRRLNQMNGWSRTKPVILSLTDLETESKAITAQLDTFLFEWKHAA